MQATSYWRIREGRRAAFSSAPARGEGNEVVTDALALSCTPPFGFWARLARGPADGANGRFGVQRTVAL